MSGPGRCIRLTTHVFCYVYPCGVPGIDVCIDVLADVKVSTATSGRETERPIQSRGGAFSIRKAGGLAESLECYRGITHAPTDTTLLPPKRSNVNDDLHFSPSCSMVVTLHDHSTSPVVCCTMYLFPIISDVRAPHRHGNIMVITWLYLSIEILYLVIHVQQQIMKL